jgi:hypothetical protein
VTSRPDGVGKRSSGPYPYPELEDFPPVPAIRARGNFNIYLHLMVI